MPRTPHAKAVIGFTCDFTAERSDMKSSLKDFPRKISCPLRRTLTRLSTFASKTPAVAGVLLVGLHYTAFRDAIREDSRQTTPSRGVTQRKKFAVEANVESRDKLGCSSPV